LEKIIITAAITGSIHTPSMSPYLPVTPEQIADEAIKAAEAGAAVVHLHMRDPSPSRYGYPSSDLELFRRVIRDIKERSDVVICLTTGGGVGMTREERIRVVPTFRPEMASLNMGSMNFGLYPIAEKFEWKYDWEKPFLLSTRDFIFRNTFQDLEFFCKTMYECGTMPELECYDIGQLYNVAQLLREGVLRAPIYVQFVFGILGGMGAEIEQLVQTKEVADRLFGRDKYFWSVIGAGRHEMGICVTAALMGSTGVRVGMEDNLYLEKGRLARSNAELVERVAELIYKTSGREPATPDEARRILGLKGKDHILLSSDTKSI